MSRHNLNYRTVHLMSDLKDGVNHGNRPIGTRHLLDRLTYDVETDFRRF